MSATIKMNFNGEPENPVPWREPPPDAEFGEIYVMDRSGHRSSFKWGQTPAELAMAKKTFDEYVAKGFTMYRLKRGGLRGRKIDEFEPDARAILAVPRMVGG